MSKKKKNYEKLESLNFGSSIGLIFGIAYWIIFDNLALALALGLSFSLVFGSSSSKKKDGED